jgi:hypothetical protein
MHILTQLVVVQDELGDRKAWPVDELRPFGEKAAPEKNRKSNQGQKKGMPNRMTESDANAVDSAAVTAELEDMAQMEQGMVSPDQKSSGQNGRRSQQNRPDNRGASANQKDGVQSSGDNKNLRSRKRNRRRRSKNKNRNTNNPQGGGNRDSKPKPSGENQNNKPKPSGGNPSQ